MREVSEIRKWGLRRTYGLITGNKLGIEMGIGMGDCWIEIGIRIEREFCSA